MIFLLTWGSRPVRSSDRRRGRRSFRAESISLVKLGPRRSDSGPLCIAVALPPRRHSLCAIYTRGYTAGCQAPFVCQLPYCCCFPDEHLSPMNDVLVAGCRARTFLESPHVLILAPDVSNRARSSAGVVFSTGACKG